MMEPGEAAVQDLILRVARVRQEMARLHGLNTEGIRVRMHPDTWRDLVRSTASRTVMPSVYGPEPSPVLQVGPTGDQGVWQVLRWPIQQDHECPRWVEPAADWRLSPTQRERERALEGLAHAGGQSPAKPLYAEIVLRV